MEIYAVRITELKSEHSLSKLMQCISTEKVEKLKRFLRQDDFMRSLIAELLIRVLIVKYKSLQNHDIYFDTTTFGKPFLKGHSLDFNLSHAGEWVVCAIGNSPVGIDIEEMSSFDLELAKHIFSNDEYSQLIEKREDERQSYFFNLWTLKESYIKAVGLGLSLPLNLFSFTISGNDITFQNSHTSEAVYFKQFDVDERYKLSVCSSYNVFPECVTVWNFDQLYTNSLLHLI